MELRHLHYFLAVLEEGSFTRAAERVHIAQPGVSAQIRQLERELGGPLFDRSARTVRLTALGSAFLPHARAALASVDQGRVAVEELTGLVRGSVTLGMVSTAAHGFPAVLADFHQAHPDVDITLSEASSAELIGALRSGTLDGAVFGLGATDPEGIGVHPLADEPVVAVLGPGDPFANRKSLTLRGIADREVISLVRGSGVRAVFDEGCAAAGVWPRIAFECSDPWFAVELAERGLGIAILPRRFATTYGERARAVPLGRPAMRARLVFAWRANGPLSPAAKALVHRVRTTLPGSAAR
ncbi:LysR family transcriptional regulator [Sciscionella sediminilitoris]|uniref:LysR family transcriptional regulator n=1 Tax=Sciscionella sediminilitoris TaxID=1445613 RepID=UPI0004DFB727|nr:LysR substrate-binding domain-containing protein [Sciscionella sp. SE31]